VTRPPAPASIPVPSQTPALGNVIVTAAASLPRQTFATVNAPILNGSPIKIPAPPVEALPSSSQSSSSQSSSSQPSPSQPNASQSATNNSLLPVPPGEIPVGNTGDMTRVTVAAARSQAFSQSSQWGAQAQSLQYRVLVADTDEQVQSQVQALVPDAFSTSLQGQSALQIGAFSSYENAQEAVQILSRNGLRGIIQPVE